MPIQFDTGSQQGGVEQMRQALARMIQWPAKEGTPQSPMIRALQALIAPQSTPQDAVAGMMPGALGMATSPSIKSPFIGRLSPNTPHRAIKTDYGIYLSDDNTLGHYDIIKKYIGDFTPIEEGRIPTDQQIDVLYKKMMNENRLGFVSPETKMFYSRDEWNNRFNKQK